MGSETDATSIAAEWLASFSAAILTGNIDALALTILEDGYLRDVLVFSWDFRTLQGRTRIKEFLSDKLTSQRFYNFQPDTSSLHMYPVAATSETGQESVSGAFTFETENALGRGAFNLVKDEKNGELWMAKTVMVEISDWKGSEEKRQIQLKDPEHLWEQEGEVEPDVLIVGAGQAGLQLAARLKQSGITCLVLEKEPRVGDNWRKRYPSLKLHVPRSYCQLLYQNFPSNYPTYIPKELLADWFESYVLSQNLPVWTSSTIKDCPSYNARTNSWTIDIIKDHEHKTLKPKHLVMALSTFGEGVIPSIPGRESFEGSQVHSSSFLGGHNYVDSRVMVIGAANSASDICVDLVHYNAKSVTLYQRSPTCVQSSAFIEALINGMFSEDVPINITDFRMGATPTMVLLESLRSRQPYANEHDKDMHDGLRKAGFKLTDGPTGAGYIELGLTRGGGYFFDSGCASLISDGTIKLKQDVDITKITKNSVVFSDGTENEVDSIIYATGFNSIRDTYKRILGEEIVKGAPDIWGLDEEGEVKGVYRPTSHPRLWYAAGDFSFARRCSKQLALLIKATELGYYKP